MLAPGSSQIEGIFRNLEADAREIFRAEGARPRLSRSADLRYQGQGFELRVDWSADAVARFHSLHARIYGYADLARAVEIVTLRVQAVVRTRKPRHTPASLTRGDGGLARIGAHRVFEEGPMAARCAVRPAATQTRRSYRRTCRDCGTERHHLCAERMVVGCGRFRQSCLARKAKPGGRA